MYQLRPSKKIKKNPDLFFSFFVQKKIQKKNLKKIQIFSCSKIERKEAFEKLYLSFANVQDKNVQTFHFTKKGSSYLFLEVCNSAKIGAKRAKKRL